MNHSHGHRVSPGFTIVELLIVIVVIAILAVVSIVAYNGIQRRASESGMQQELKTSATILETDKVKSTTGGRYPDEMAMANDGKGLKTSSTNALQYTLGDINGTSYCMSITSTKTPQAYNFSSTRGTVEAGFCPGHSASILTTIAGSTSGWFDSATGSTARFNLPKDVAIADDGTIYVSDGNNHRIRQVSQSGAVTTIAGTGSAGFSNNATGTLAQFSYPIGIDIDASNSNLYVADGSHRIRKISLTAPYAVTTIAGTGVAGFADGAGATAQFNEPYGIAVNASGIVYVSEGGGHRIRSISTSNVVSTLAGSTSGSVGATGSTDNATGSLARFYYPHGIDIDASGNIYVADSANNRIRRITPAGAVTTVAGSGTDGYLDGAALTAQFSYPEAVAVAANGNMYISDAYNGVIRGVVGGNVTTLVGQRFNSGFSDGTGAAGRISYPWGLEVGSDGMVYLADTWNHRVRKVEPR